MRNAIGCNLQPARQYEIATPADVDYDILGFGVPQYSTKYCTAIYEHNILIWHVGNRFHVSE